MNITPKLDFVDQQPDEGVMHKLQLGEANCSTRQALDPRPEIEVFALNFLGVALTRLVLARVEVALV